MQASLQRRSRQQTVVKATAEDATSRRAALAIAAAAVLGLAADAAQAGGAPKSAPGKVYGILH